jgi:hypothetical protein
MCSVRRCAARTARAALLMVVLAAAAPSRADERVHDNGHEGHNLELFLSAERTASSGSNAATERNENAWGIADIVFSLNHDRLRLMGEYNLSSDEHDLERFQVGIEPVADTLIWLGRFHQPGSAWNNEFHHGHYLQTPVTRPSIEYWEDEEGAVPQHLVGALIDSRRPLGETAGLEVSLGAGYASALYAEHMDPIDLLNRNGRGHRLSVTARLAYSPKYLGATSFGLLFGHHRLPVVDAALLSSLQADQVEQNIVGLYGDWVDERWRVLAVGYYVDLSLRGAAARRAEHFASGYLQLERLLPHALTVFARHENSANAGQSTYVSVHGDDFVVHGLFGGVRWDFAHRQALTLELSRIATVGGTLDTARVQWSAAIP